MNNLQIHYFIVTAKNKSFSKASNELFITQPSLSKQIKNMEQELGAELFDRSKNPIELTLMGNMYYNFFLNYTGELAKLRQLSKEESGSYEELLTIGIISGCLLPKDTHRKLKLFSEQYPAIKLVYENHNPHNLVNLLRCHSIDACFIFTDFVADFSDIHYEALNSVKKYIVYSRNILDDPAKKIEISDFADKVFFCPDEDSADQTLRLMTSYCLKYNIYPTIKSMPNIESVMTNVAFGNGVAIVDSLTQFNTTSFIDRFEIQPGHTFCLAWRASEFTPELQLLRDSLIAN